MLTLTAEQVRRLEALQATRDQQRIGSLVGSAFPDVAARLGDRFPALVAHAVQRGAAHGLHHAACIARYLACWCVLGAEFETRADHAWAAALLGDRDRPEGAKAYQLGRRTREHLARPAGTTPAGATPPITMEAFDQALATLDEALLDRGPVGSLHHGPRITLGAACDIDGLDVRPADAAKRPRYVLEQGQWRLEQATPPGAAVTVGTGPNRLAALPPRLSLLASQASDGGTPARLRVRCLATACCDPALHPLVSLNDAAGLREWRGPLAADVVLELYAEPPADLPEKALPPLIAAASPPRLALLGFASCGLRDGGPPLPPQQTHLAVHAAEQHLLAWHREPGAPIAWPPGDAAAGAAGTVLRIERDGRALDARAWLAAWQALDEQLAMGLDRLYTAWGRESGLERTTMHAEPEVFCGDAGIAWGWSEAPAGLAAPSFFRVLGRLDIVACRLALRMSGELTFEGSLSRLTLECHAQERLQTDWETGPDAAATLPVPPQQRPAQQSVRLPFVLHVEPVVGTTTALLASGPATGAIVGDCGLRLRPDGLGLQWFVRVAVEPVHATLQVHHPLLGRTTQTRRLLPALTLADWSLG
jgi:hypothetical protein